MSVLHSILKTAAAMVGLSSMELTKGGRQKELVLVRRAFCLVGHEYGETLGFIGRVIGRDHTTVLHHVRKARAEMATDSKLREMVEVLREAVAGSYAERQVKLAEVRRKAEAEREALAAARLRERSAEAALAELRGLPKMLRGVDYPDAGMPRSWWEKNNQRFADAMQRAHPNEHYPSLSMRAVPGTVEAAA